MIQFEETTAYTIPEMSKILGLSEKTVRKYCTAGQIQAKKIGRKWHATGKALQAFLCGEQTLQRGSE